MLQRMRLEHVELWVADLEGMRAFYEKYFQTVAGPKYRNEGKQFTSYFISFPGGGRLELMHRPDNLPNPGAFPAPDRLGYVRLGLEVESRAQVDALTDRLRADGLPVLDGPRTTGDGYYESIVADPEGNRILIVERRI
jgi:lactoylglutathione lyase